MKLLLDTNILLWLAADILPETAARYILDESNTLLFSPASIWEVVIKRGLNRADFIVDPTALYRGLLDNGYEELRITGKHALTVSSLPLLHKDPFDRMLLAQAVSEGIPLMTADACVAQYPADIIFIGK
ncbi:MAG: type II toxin-antitoxin system VapC family toxin [Defluviitaleaceae bacterium]|nr:type II toxin-antitoxin system VapC family toxin [Defluviitaleaceae bacterium]